MTALPHDDPRWHAADDPEAKLREALGTLRRFQERTLAHRAAAEEALAATNLLRAASYPGADDLRDALIPICGSGEHPLEGLPGVLQSLEWLFEADGDPGAWALLFADYMRDPGETVEEFLMADLSAEKLAPYLGCESS